MTDAEDIHETARGFFLCKVANGGVPATVAGGVHDGLRYFIIELDGETYWLTEDGLRIPHRGDGELVLSEDPWSARPNASEPDCQ